MKCVMKWNQRQVTTVIVTGLFRPTTTLGMSVSPMQTWRIVHDLGVVSNRPKLEHAKDYEKKKKILDNYKKIFAALLKKNPPRI
jgi:hypothetical protein